MLAKLQPAFIITRREIRDQLRDWRIIIPIVILTIFFPYLMNFTAERAINFVAGYGANIIGERLIPFLLMVVGFFPASFSLIIALESFVGEKERGSIEPLLTSPLSDWQLYLGKLIAVMVPPTIASFLGITVYLVSLYRDIGWVLEVDLVVQILALTFVQTLVMVSGAVVISTQATSVRAANLLASFIIIPVALAMQAESMVMFWGQYDALWWVVLGLMIVVGLLVRTGVGHFNREELLGKELDVLNFRWMWKIYLDQFRGKATSLVMWYRIEIRALLIQLRLPFIILVFMLVGAYYVGVGQAKIFVIPPELFELSNLRGNLLQGFEQVTLYETGGPVRILLHNIRALVLATVFGLFTYGVLGILVVLLPIILIGYFSASMAPAGIETMDFLLGFVAPHGIIEIPAILLAAAAIYRMGANLAASSNGRSISEGLLHSFADWTKIMVGVVIPLLFFAAVLETYITPQIAAMIFK